MAVGCVQPSASGPVDDRLHIGPYGVTVTNQAVKAEQFLRLHHGETPLLLPNPWDEGTAKLFFALGFRALATTSSGHAATLGRLDGGVTRDEALGHAAAIVAATDLPVSADLENCFADDPAGVADTVRLAMDTGVAGCSVEDYTGSDDHPIYELAHAADRVAAAAEAAHSKPVRLVLTARSENYLHNRPDLSDTVARLQAFQAAGADVLYAPGVIEAADIRRIVESVDLPVNVLALPGVPSVAELAELGVARVSVGGGLNLVGLGAVVKAARELLQAGTYSYWDQAQEGIAVRSTAFE